MKLGWISSILLLFFCCNSKSNTIIDSISNKKDESVTVCTWNIGHFSKGEKDYSLIPSSKSAEIIVEFKSFVYDSIKADILCLNEYESEFCVDSIYGNIIAEDAIFGDYLIHRIGKKNSYICNAMFSNIALKDIRRKEFKYEKKTKVEIPRIDWYYFITSDIIIGGEKVRLVCTHLVNRAEEYCQNQMEELIKACEKFERVIICGDMNSWNFTKFKNAGYTLANDASLVTFPSKSYALDNIMVKNLIISDVRVIKTELSDHYPLVCKVSLK